MRCKKEYLIQTTLEAHRPDICPTQIGKTHFGNNSHFKEIQNSYNCLYYLQIDMAFIQYIYPSNCPLI